MADSCYLMIQISSSSGSGSAFAGHFGGIAEIQIERGGLRESFSAILDFPVPVWALGDGHMHLATSLASLNAITSEHDFPHGLQMAFFGDGLAKFTMRRNSHALSTCFPISYTYTYTCELLGKQ